MKHYSSFLWALIGLLMGLLPGEVFSQDEPKIDFGGALRFNYNLSSWKDGQKNRGGDFGFDTFMINVNGSYQDIYIDAEYRFYSEVFGGNFLKQGVIGYKMDEKNQFEVGLAKVPFGIELYNSHNFFFNLPYYVGLEDDYDMGVTYRGTRGKWEFHLGYFKNAEELVFGNNSEITDSRYSYDVAGRNKENHQGNAKIIYKPLENDVHKIGVSLKYGGLYNLDTGNTGDRYGFAAHYEYKTEDWFIKAQALTAGFNPDNPPGEPDNVIQMTAFGAPYSVASKFDIYNIGLARFLDVDTDLIKRLRLYNDFGYMRKHEEGFEDSIMNVTGIMINSGFIYIYFDYAAGYNHSWLGGNYVDDFAQGNPDAKWEARFNINIGYYF